MFFIHDNINKKWVKGTIDGYKDVESSKVPTLRKEAAKRGGIRSDEELCKEH